MLQVRALWIASKAILRGRNDIAWRVFEVANTPPKLAYEIINHYSAKRARGQK